MTSSPEQYFRPTDIKGVPGIALSIRVSPRSSRSGPLGLHGDNLRWGVRAAPTDGKANKELIAAIAKAAGVAKSQVKILSGESAREKQVFVAIEGERRGEFERYLRSIAA